MTTEHVHPVGAPPVRPSTESPDPGRTPARLVVVNPLPAERLEGAKAGFTTRRADRAAMRTLVSGALRPRSGDLVLAEVERLGQHGRVELPNGRKARLNVGDEILVAYADRYAPDQYEAEVPGDLGPAELVASGGVAARVITKSSAVHAATRIRPIGLVGDADGVPINVLDYRLPSPPSPRSRPTVIAVVGTSMNSGKTTTIQHLVRGLHLAGRRPGSTKVTGTGSGNDFWVMMDAGAHRMVDFTDAGYASTYRIPMPEVERVFVDLVDTLAASGCGVILVEVADGIYQQETARLIDSPVFRTTVDAMIFAAGEALGAVHGVQALRSLGLPILGVSGKLTASPLAIRETVRAIDLPVYTIEQLHDPVFAAALLDGIDRDAAEAPVPAAATAAPPASIQAATPARPALEMAVPDWPSADPIRWSAARSRTAPHRVEPAAPELPPAPALPPSPAPVAAPAPAARAGEGEVEGEEVPFAIPEWPTPGRRRAAVPVFAADPEPRRAPRLLPVEERFNRLRETMGALGE